MVGAGGELSRTSIGWCRISFTTVSIAPSVARPLLVSSATCLLEHVPELALVDLSSTSSPNSSATCGMVDPEKLWNIEEIEPMKA
jgi:hypothetical protein